MEKRNLLRKVLQLLIVLFLSFPMMALAQNITISGVVNDDGGQPLPGVSIIVEGTTTGTITNIDGQYSIEAPSDAKLTYQFMGFTPQTVEISNRTSINITLKEDVVDIGEVVVVGYGTQRKEAVTGSVASVGAEKITEVPASNISQALEGRVAGVQMSQTSSKPGSTMQIRIRGTRSINADNNPLIILDGIPFAGTIADISTDDIKSIDILKDASATAIYGSRGANGVIIITSNSGRKKQAAKVAFNSYFGIKNAVKFPMMNAQQYQKLRNLENLDYGSPANDEPATDNGDGTYTYTADTDWQDLTYRKGIVQNYDVSVTGGTAKGSYKFGVNYYKDEAVIPLQYYERYSFRASLDQEIGEYIHLGFTSNNNYNIMNGSSLNLYGILSLSPVCDPYNDDGSLKNIVELQDNAYTVTEDKLNGLGDSYYDKTKSFGSYNSLFLEVKIPYVDGLKYRINLGGNVRISKYGYYKGVGVFSATETSENTATISDKLTTNWAVENLLTYDKAFGKHRINAIGLYSAEQTSYNCSKISRKNIDGDSFQCFNLGRSSTSSTDDITIDPDSQDYTESGLMSYMGRIMYSYDDKYMISATVRSDGSSRLAEGHQWHTYPAVSLGWNVNRESFMATTSSWLDKLKIRYGYGQTSNQAIDPYSTLGVLSSRPYNYGTTYATGLYVTTAPNPNLGWEYSDTHNFGIDFSLYNRRLSGSFEVYSTYTKDLLLSVNMPSTSGVSSYMANVGETSNKGFELSLNGVIIDNKNGWTWEAGINLYHNVNKIEKLASGFTEDTDNWLFVGHSLNCIYDYKEKGLWQSDETEELMKYEGFDQTNAEANVGMIKVEYTGEYDDNGDPVREISSEDKQVIDCDPDFQGGFNTRVAYKNIDLSIVGSFQHGGILNSTLYGSNGYLNQLNGRINNVDVDYWTPDNTDAKFPNPTSIKNSNNPKYGSTLGYFDASYLKVKTITLGYNFDKNLISKVGISNARLYATVQNPMVLFSPYHKESGMDPETNSYADDSSTQAVAVSSSSSNKSRLLVVGYNTPVTKNIIFGINVTF